MGTHIGETVLGIMATTVAQAAHELRLQDAANGNKVESEESYIAQALRGGGCDDSPEKVQRIMNFLHPKPLVVMLEKVGSSVRTTLFEMRRV